MIKLNSPFSDSEFEDPSLALEIMNHRIAWTNENIDRAFSLYKDSMFLNHVEKNQGMMISAAKGCRGRLVVMGPANMEVNVLKILGDKFKEIVLVGYDEKELKRIAKEVPHATWIVADLAGGAINKFAELIKKFNDRTFSYEAAMEELIEIYKTHDPATGTLKASIGKADYVISSLVSSMLSGEPVRMVQDAFEQHYGQFCDPDELGPFETRLSKFHLDLLKGVGKRVYFADTMRITHEDEPELVTYISDDVEDYMEENFDVIMKKIWTWECSEERSFKVLGSILNTKKGKSKKHKIK